jgi:aspartate kinase
VKAEGSRGYPLEQTPVTSGGTRSGTAPAPATSNDPYVVRVVKFGGSSFESLDDYHRVAAYLLEMLGDASSRIVAVVSGMAGTTDRLLAAARAIDADLEPVVQDQILATAEIVSAGLLRAALHARGCSTVDLCAGQSGIRAGGNAARPTIASIDTRPILDAFADHRIVIVAGAQAADADGRTVMLGRNSSDLTAVALAAPLGADTCEIVSDVPGIYTADPYVVPSARRIPELSYAQCVAISESGAKVLHWAAVLVAQADGVTITCRALADDLTDRSPGTVVGVGRGATVVVGDRDVSMFRVVGDVDAVVDRLRRDGLVANRVVDGAEVLLAFRSGQRGVVRALAEMGVTAEPVRGRGLVTVVSGDGAVNRQLVRTESVHATVRALHGHVYGEIDAAVSVASPPKGARCP